MKHESADYKFLKNFKIVKTHIQRVQYGACNYPVIASRAIRLFHLPVTVDADDISFASDLPKRAKTVLVG